jgi:hypothetical protein
MSTLSKEAIESIKVGDVVRTVKDNQYVFSQYCGLICRVKALMVDAIGYTATVVLEHPSCGQFFHHTKHLDLILKRSE